MKLPIVFIGEAPSFNILDLARLLGLEFESLERCMVVSSVDQTRPMALTRARMIAEISSLAEHELGRSRAAYQPRESTLRRAPSLAKQEALWLVFCGRRASTAAQLPALPWASWAPWGAIAGRWVEVACIPHPSGSNPSYADPALKAQIAGFLKNTLTIAAGGENLAEP